MKTRKEQIIEILQDKIKLSLSSNYKSVYIDGLDKCADAILALPLDVPSDEEIDKQVDDDFCFNSPMYIEGVKRGMKSMRDEIIKRNQP